MPSHLPSSFASAAAGSTRDTRNGRGDGRGSGDWYVDSPSCPCRCGRWWPWTITIQVHQEAPENYANVRGSYRSRREQRPANGTLTLRRNSQAPYNHLSQDAPVQTPTAETPGLSHQSNPYDSAPSGSRYSKQEILDIANARKETAGATKNVASLFLSGWDPDSSNGSNGRSGWGKTSDGRDSYGPEVCWNRNGDTVPISFEEMSEAEKTVGVASALVTDLADGRSSLLQMSTRRSSRLPRTPTRIKMHLEQGQMAGSRLSRMAKTPLRLDSHLLHQADPAQDASLHLMPCSLHLVLVASLKTSHPHFSVGSSLTRKMGKMIEPMMRSLDFPLAV